MKRLFLALVLALLAAGAAHAQLVQIDGGWINPMTGQFYPSAGDNTAVDQNTGRTLVVPGRDRNSAPAVQAELPSCDQVHTAIARVERNLAGRDTSTPAYAVTYGKWQKLQQYAASYCR